MYIEVNAETKNQEIDFELRNVSLYHNNGFNTNVQDIKQLENKKFVWDISNNDKDEEAGYLNEKEIRDYLKNLEDFINCIDDNIDPLIKVCLIHYQFESIHPFYDGNGRTGRILNILYLVLNNLIDSPILYLSKYINETKQEYYKLFKDVRESGNFEDWILYILKGVEITSKNTFKLIEKIQNEMKSYKEEFKAKLPKIYSKELLESLFYEVYTKIAYVEKACSVTRLTATSYLNQLEEIGLLESEKIGREKIYKNVRLIKLLSES